MEQGSVSFHERLRVLMHQDARYTVRIHVAAGNVVYTSNVFDDAVYFVEKGQVKVGSQVTESGKICILGVFRAGDVFGETCIVGAGHGADTVIAMKATTLRKMSSLQFRARLKEAGLFEDFARHLAARVLEQQKVITEFATLSSEYRLATTLVRLSSRMDERGPFNRRIKERISCQELAEMVGTTRSRVGYFLKKFHHEGLISTSPGCFLLINESAFTTYVWAALEEQSCSTSTRRQARDGYKVPFCSQVSNAMHSQTPL